MYQMYYWFFITAYLRVTRLFIFKLSGITHQIQFIIFGHYIFYTFWDVYLQKGTK